MRRSALVIGGSLGGLLAAQLLQRQGWRVDVYERALDDLAGRGAGIGTHDELFEVLRRLGVAIDEGFGVRVSERICLDVSGRAIHRTPWNAVMAHWARIYRALKDQLSAAHYHRGKSFRDFSREGGEIVAHFDDGSRARADLLIGADGLRSTVRARLFEA